MRLLILTPQLPYPPHQGTSLRNYNIMRGLADDHQITLLSFRDGEEEQISQDLGPLRELCDRIITIPQTAQRSQLQRLAQLVTKSEPDVSLRLRSSRFDIALRRLLSEESFDVVQIEGIELAWTIASIRAITVAQKIVFDAHNAETQLQNRAYMTDRKIVGRWPAAAYSRLQRHRLERYENWACETSDWVVAVSQGDKEILAAQLAGNQPGFSVIPNSIDVRQYESYVMAATGGESARNKGFDLVFSGKMDYRPNVDAVLWFADAVWPELKEARPELTWAIVGQKPHKRLAHLGNLPGVTVTGWVEDVKPYLLGGTVFVMPFRVGSGTRLKLVEAFAIGIPVVSTTMGVEGYAVENNRELLLANSGPDMAAAILQLLDRPELQEGLSAAGHVFAQAYDWRRITPKFNEVYHGLVAQKKE